MTSFFVFSISFFQMLVRAHNKSVLILVCCALFLSKALLPTVWLLCAMCLTSMPTQLKCHGPFSLLSSGQLVRFTTCCLGVFLQNLIKVPSSFRQNKKNFFNLEGYRRHPKTKQWQKNPYTVSKIEAMELRLNAIIYCNL